MKTEKEINQRLNELINTVDILRKDKEAHKIHSIIERYDSLIEELKWVLDITIYD